MHTQNRRRIALRLAIDFFVAVVVVVSIFIRGFNFRQFLILNHFVELLCAQKKTKIKINSIDFSMFRFIKLAEFTTHLKQKQNILRRCAIKTKKKKREAIISICFVLFLLFILFFFV